jgi:hypothetical protein
VGILFGQREILAIFLTLNVGVIPIFKGVFTLEKSLPGGPMQVRPKPHDPLNLP